MEQNQFEGKSEFEILSSILEGGLSEKSRQQLKAEVEAMEEAARNIKEPPQGPMYIPSDYTAAEFIEVIGEEEAKRLHLI